MATPSAEGSPPAGPAQGGETRPPRVGLWLGLLLLFVPIAWPLLWLKPYSWVARLGWGGWLGLIVFVKLAGLSEPVIDLTRIEGELRLQESAPAGAGGAPTGRATFVQPDDEQRPPPPLDAYLRELGGGVLGRRIVETQVQGEEIRIAFQETAPFLPNEARIAEEAIGAALSLFYGRDFRRVTLDFVHAGRPLRVTLSRAEFQDFFALGEAEIRAMLADPVRQAQSIFHAEHLPPALRTAFFERFARYR